MANTSLDDAPDEPEEKSTEAKSEEAEKGKPEPEKPKEKRWVEDETRDDAEVVKLNVHESIEGIYLDKFYSGKYTTDCYKIKPKDSGKAKIIVGDTILNKRMANKKINDELKIERLEDGRNQAGQVYHNWNTYHLE